MVLPALPSTHHCWDAALVPCSQLPAAAPVPTSHQSCPWLLQCPGGEEEASLSAQAVGTPKQSSSASRACGAGG